MLVNALKVARLTKRRVRTVRLVESVKEDAKEAANSTPATLII